MIEEWKQIEDFPEYSVSNLGNIQSHKRNQIKLLKPSATKPYFMVDLCKDGKIYTHTIHKLVASHFVHNPENKPEVDHLDRNPYNNVASNLSWVTRSENLKNRNWYYRSGQLGEPYITLRHTSFKVQIPKLKIYKNFKNLEEAIQFRDAILLANQTSLQKTRTAS